MKQFEVLSRRFIRVAYSCSGCIGYCVPIGDLKMLRPKVHKVRRHDGSRVNLVSRMSRPPTPSSKVQTKQSEWRFHHINVPTEWIEDHRPGGLHPIHLGDSLNGNLYKIL
jgi:hypothetical protein